MIDEAEPLTEEEIAEKEKLLEEVSGCWFFLNVKQEKFRISPIFWRR
jgi:hypothetical protein